MFHLVELVGTQISAQRSSCLEQVGLIFQQIASSVSPLGSRPGGDIRSHLLFFV